METPRRFPTLPEALQAPATRAEALGLRLEHYNSGSPKNPLNGTRVFRGTEPHAFFGGDHIAHLARLGQVTAFLTGYEQGQQAPPDLYTLSIDHREGTDVDVFRSYAAARAALAKWAREWFPTEAQKAPNPMPQADFDRLSDDDAIVEYFDSVSDRESYTLNRATING